MEEADFFGNAPPSEAPPPVPDNAPIVLGPPSENSAMYVGDVDETPAHSEGDNYQAFGDAEDNPYQSFGDGTNPADDGPYQSFGEPMGNDDLGFAASDTMGFASPENQAPILLGAPGDGVPSGEEDTGVTSIVPEASPMQKWNDEFQELLNQRREAENAKRGEQVEAARLAMEEFHANREARREARFAKNRQDEQAKLEAIEADLENDNSWQRVCKMVELTHDSTKEAADLKRMRDVLIHLKNDPARAQALS